MEGGLLILGNGFDLDLGLHTRYSEFWESESWKTARQSCPEKYLVSSLERYRITHQWFDLESGLQDGANRLLNRLSHDFDGRNYYESFHILVNELRKYIKEQQEHFTPNSNSVAERILRAINARPLYKCIYTFNYTDIVTMSQRFHVSELPPVYYMHGSLQPDDQIILGVEVEDFSSIPPQLTFLIKSNSPYYHYNNLLNDLEKAEDVVFFGHSINGMDFPYFKEYFMSLNSMPMIHRRKRHVTIITYDEQSEMQIKDNFRANGIDVRSLYNKVALEFIQTKGIYENNRAEIEKLNEMMKGEY